VSTRAPAGPRGSFERTVAALVDAIVRDRLTADGALVPEVTDFVLAQHAHMPAHLRAGVRVATVAFGLAAALGDGRSFHRAAVPRRRARLARWRRARLAPCRDLVRFWESLVVYGWLTASEPHAP
jgi:hypothetical protein